MANNTVINNITDRRLNGFINGVHEVLLNLAKIVVNDGENHPLDKK